MKKIVILGSTGSIGINTLKIVDRYPDKFKVVGLTAYNNFKLLEKQAKIFRPSQVAVSSKGIDYFRNNGQLNGTKILNAEDELSDLVSHPSVDIVVIGMRGSAALKPFLSAVRAGKRVAPANKEALVVAGELIMKEARKYGAKVIPVDSEQSAIFQCLEGHNKQELHKVYLTASGGTLRNVPRSKFDKLSVKQILNHPRWKMGKKITVDSATLMNKGFEIIEAARLFDLDVNDIEVLVHPEAIIHSMVGFKDGSIIAQLGVTDMRLPIQYAMTYPNRIETGLREMDFFKLERLTFEKPNFKKFPALDLAYHVARKGGSLPCVLNAADEVAVDAFLNGKLQFSKIVNVVEKVVLGHKIIKKPSINQLTAVDQAAREAAKRLISK